MSEQLDLAMRTYGQALTPMVTAEEFVTVPTDATVEDVMTAQNVMRDRCDERLLALSVQRNNAYFARKAQTE